MSPLLFLLSDTTLFSSIPRHRAHWRSVFFCFTNSWFSPHLYNITLMGDIEHLLRPRRSLLLLSPSCMRVWPCQILKVLLFNGLRICTLALQTAAYRLYSVENKFPFADQT